MIKTDCIDINVLSTTNTSVFFNWSSNVSSFSIYNTSKLNYTIVEDNTTNITSLNKNPFSLENLLPGTTVLLYIEIINTKCNSSLVTARTCKFDRIYSIIPKDSLS